MQRCSRRSALKRIVLFLLFLPLMFTYIYNLICIGKIIQANPVFVMTLVCRGRTTSINQPKCGSRKGVKHALDVPTLTGGVKTKCLPVSLPRQGAACFTVLGFCFCFPLFTCNCPCVASRRWPWLEGRCSVPKCFPWWDGCKRCWCWKLNFN